MIAETYRQHYVDSLVVKLTDTADAAGSVLIANHVVDFKESPSLDESLEYADWCWDVFVAGPLGVLLADVPVTPTDLDDVRLHFRMVQRRKHIEVLEMARKLEASLPPEEDDKIDLPGGQYL